VLWLPYIYIYIYIYIYWPKRHKSPIILRRICRDEKLLQLWRVAMEIPRRVARRSPWWHYVRKSIIFTIYIIVTSSPSSSSPPAAESAASTSSKFDVDVDAVHLDWSSISWVLRGVLGECWGEYDIETTEDASNVHLTHSLSAMYIKCYTDAFLRLFFNKCPPCIRPSFRNNAMCGFDHLWNSRWIYGRVSRKAIF